MTEREKWRRRGLSEKEIDRVLCVHDFGKMCMWTFMGCSRTCRKCGQIQVDPNHCGQYEATRSPGGGDG